MKNIIAVMALMILLAALLPCVVSAVQSVTADVGVTVYCFNVSLNLTTDKTTYQYSETPNMTVLINNTQNYENLSEVLLIELYDVNGNFVKYMATDAAVAPGNGTNTTSYAGDINDVATGNYTLRARLIGNFAYPGQNTTIHDCSLAALAAQSDVNITITQLMPNPPGNLRLILNKTSGPNYEDVTLNWTLSNSTNVVNYIIYKTDEWYLGFNYSNPYMTVPNTTTNWTDNSSDGTYERYYVVRAYNDLGMTDENTYAVGKFNLQLYTAWNLIAVPMLVWNESMSDIFYTAENGDLSNRWVATTPTFQRSDYFAGQGWFGDYNTMQADRGYWYFSHKLGHETVPFNNTVVGVVPTEVSAAETIYGKQWSLLGWTSVNIKPMNEAFVNAANGDLVNYYDAAHKTFLRSDYFKNYGGWFGDFDDMFPGYGFWYYSQNATSYTWVHQP